MKIGFSSLVCPAWDLPTMVSKAAEYGFHGVEIRGLQGELKLTGIPSLAGNPSATKSLFASAGIELVCISTSCSFSSRDRKQLALQRAELDDHIDLASRLGCPFVRMFVGEVQKGEARENTLSRIAAELTKMAPLAASRRVGILVSNGGDFPGSADLWYLCDAVSHPAMRACWDPCVAMTGCELPTISIPRLGGKLGMVHVCDGDFNEMGYLSGGYKAPGTGQVPLTRMIDLLKGIYYQDYLMFQWPKLWEPSLSPPDQILPQAAAFLKERLAATDPILSAYKGKDKKGPTFKPIPVRSPGRPM